MKYPEDKYKMLRFDPEEVELRQIKNWVRNRYDRNIEFVPAEEVVEMILEWSKYERRQNRILLELLEDYTKYSLYSLPIGFYGKGLADLCQPLEKK